MITLSVAALLLLVERMLRLFDMVANEGGPVGVVFRMLGNLIPRYMGLALPLALFLGVLLAFRKLSASSELEALQASGLGLTRVMRAAFVLSIFMFGLNIALLGYLTPRSYYSYQSLLFELSSGAFGASIQPGSYQDLGNGFTLRIGESRQDGSRLLDIFAQKERPGGHTTTITAREGEFLATPNGETVLFRLYDGLIVDVMPGIPSPRVFEFKQHDWSMTLPEVEEFRVRGGRERELTLDELWTESQDETRPLEEQRTYIGAFWDRVLRSAIMLVLPFLAVGLGVVSKRRQHSIGLAVGLVMLLTLHKMQEFGVAAIGLGNAGLFTGLFLPFGLFTLLSGYFFYITAFRPGGDPLGWFGAMSDALLEQLTRLYHRARSAYRRARAS